MKTFDQDLRDGPLYNPIINGNFDFWQRGTTITRTQALNSEGMMADRFYQGVSSGGSTKSITCNRSTNVPSSPFLSSYSLETVNNTAIPSLAAGDYLYACYSLLEGNIFSPLFGKDFTIGFWFNTSVAGTYSATVRTASSTNSFVGTFVATVGWGYYSVVVPWSASITVINASPTVGIFVGAIAGSTYQAPSLNVWTSGNCVGHSSLTNWAATSGATLRVSQLQLRSGSWSSDDMKNSFQRTGANYAQELQLCQRYYEKSYELDVVPGAITFSGSAICSATGSSGTGALALPVGFKVTKRAIPSCSPYNSDTGTKDQLRISFPSNIPASCAGIGVNGMYIRNDVTVGTGTVGWAQWTADADY